MSSCTRFSYSQHRPPYHIATFRVKEEPRQRPRYSWGPYPLRELLASRDLQVSISHCHALINSNFKKCFHEVESRVLCLDNWVRNHSLQLFLHATCSYPISSTVHTLISFNKSKSPFICAAHFQCSAFCVEAWKSSPFLEASPALAAATKHTVH